MSNKVHPHPHAPDPGGLALPRFERVNYFYGQLLGVREFRSEQQFFREKHRLHNRYLHGYGVVCGLEVRRAAAPADPCAPPPPADALPASAWIEIGCGLALDCSGNEIAVAWPTPVDVLAHLSCAERAELLNGKTAYVSLCFVEQPIEPVRPVSADSCGGLVPECVPSRWRDDFCVRVSLEAPPHVAPCSSCDTPCGDPCLPLATVSWNRGLHVDHTIRRTIAPFAPTRIAGVSWAHGGAYPPALADQMLREGLVIEFSDDVHAETLRRGVLDLWIVQGGGGRRGDIYSAPIELVPGNSGAQLTRWITARVPAHRADRIDPGDRVIIQLRSAFVLDRCCRAVDGEHIGGLVPQLPAYHAIYPSSTAPQIPPCTRPEPRTLARWMSGNGMPAGNFESWFYIGDDDDDNDRCEDDDADENPTMRM